MDMEGKSLQELINCFLSFFAVFQSGKLNFSRVFNMAVVSVRSWVSANGFSSVEEMLKYVVKEDDIASSDKAIHDYNQAVSVNREQLSDARSDSVRSCFTFSLFSLSSSFFKLRASVSWPCAVSRPMPGHS